MKHTMENILVILTVIGLVIFLNLPWFLNAYNLLTGQGNAQIEDVVPVVESRSFIPAHYVEE